MFYFEKFEDKQLVELINNRNALSDSVWNVIKKVYAKNTLYYDCETSDKERMPEYLRRIPQKYHKTRSNRIFRNVESVINALIAKNNYKTYSEIGTQHGTCFVRVKADYKECVDPEKAFSGLHM